MKSLRILLFLSCTLMLLSGATSGITQSSKYKCMIQLINYQGEGAYMVASVLDKDGQYVETLKVIGDDQEWYPDLEEWYAFYESADLEIDGITGATISGGERTIFSLELDQRYIDAEYTLRIETAVEDQAYHTEDIKLSLQSGQLAGSHNGNGYIRYIKLLGQ